jgi:hypothetical protein
MDELVGMSIKTDIDQTTTFRRIENDRVNVDNGNGNSHINSVSWHLVSNRKVNTTSELHMNDSNDD